MLRFIQFLRILPSSFFASSSVDDDDLRDRLLLGGGGGGGGGGHMPLGSETTRFNCRGWPAWGRELRCAALAGTFSDSSSECPMSEGDPLDTPDSVDGVIEGWS